MKKTIPIALVFSFIFAMTAQMPVFAEDATTTSDLTAPVPMLTSFNSEETNTSTPPVPMLISANPENGMATNTPRIEPRTGAPRPTIASSTMLIGKNFEKISKPEYVKYFNEIKKIGNVLFGIRKTPVTTDKLNTGGAMASTTAGITSTSTLQRIPSPAHISLFEKIVKIGQDLFGVKKNNSGNKATTTPIMATSSLEKITSLDQIKLFDQIKKIGSDLFGLRKTSTYVLPTMTADLLTCTSAAIDAKDSAISASLTTAASEISTAIAARGVCQKAALALSSGQQKALSDCNQTFQKAQKSANDKVRSVQKETWTTYSNSLKTCAQTAKVSEIRIEDGGQNVMAPITQ